jgi:hypothetical protein
MVNSNETNNLAAPWYLGLACLLPIDNIIQTAFDNWLVQKRLSQMAEQQVCQSWWFKNKHENFYGHSKQSSKHLTNAFEAKKNSAAEKYFCRRGNELAAIRIKIFLVPQNATRYSPNLDSF